MLQDVGFWEAVGLWWSGKKLEDFTMYGWRMLYWARLGKLLQFVGGGVIVLDLIGPGRLREWAESTQHAGKKLWRATKAWWKLSIPLRWDTSRQSAPILFLSFPLFLLFYYSASPGIASSLERNISLIFRITLVVVCILTISLISLLFGWLLIWALTQGFALYFHGSNEDHDRGEHGSLSTGIHADTATFRNEYLPLSLNLTKRSLIFLIPWVSFSLLLSWNLRSGEYLRVLEAGNPFELFAWSVFDFCLSSAIVWLLLQSVIGPVTFLAYFAQGLLLFTAYVFRHDNPRHPIRWIAFAVVAVGFLLDLLGS